MIEDDRATALAFVKNTSELLCEKLDILANIVHNMS